MLNAAVRWNKDMSKGIYFYFSKRVSKSQDNMNSYARFFVYIIFCEAYEWKFFQENKKKRINLSNFLQWISYSFLSPISKFIFNCPKKVYQFWLIQSIELTKLDHFLTDGIELKILVWDTEKQKHKNKNARQLDESHEI